MRLVLVRHGETEETWQPDTGHIDPPLSALGRRQALALARELHRLHLDGAELVAVYSSPQAAALATAESICDTLGLPPPEVNRSLASLTPEQLPDGALEGLAALQAQAWTAVESLKEMHSAEANLVLSTHELPIRALICRALGMPLQDYRNFAVEHASISVIEFRGPRTLLGLLNDVCHLE